MMVSRIFEKVKVKSPIFGGIFALAILCLCSSCAHMGHCPPERLALPSESNFVKIAHASHGDRYPFWRTRSPGRPVLLLHALNGISPRTLDLALEMEKWGYRVYIPSLYGNEVLGESPYGFDNAKEANRLLKKSDDWDLASPNRSSPILEDIREMSRWVCRQEKCSDLIVIGNCLTGIFPMALLQEKEVKTAVIAQPALPVKSIPAIVLQLPQLPYKASGLALSDHDWEKTTQALQSDREKRIIGFHYYHDPLAPFSKFRGIRRHLKSANLEGRFDAYILASASQLKQLEKDNWMQVGTTRERRTMFFPHSTIINPENPEDRIWFRSALRKALQP